MFSEILIPIVVSKSTKRAFFFFFLSVKGMPFNCTAIHLHYKIQYTCWKELMFYESMVAAVIDA